RPGIRSFVIQLLLLVFVVLVAWFIFRTTRQNIVTQRIPIGFDFFWIESGFSISQTLIAFNEGHSYARAFLVGLLNTLLVSALGVVFATVIGFLVGIGRLSHNWIIARLCGGYVEVIRNLPLLFQILFWYLAVLAALPGPRQSIGLWGDIYLNNRGIMIPKPVFGDGIDVVFAVLGAGVALAVILVLAVRRFTVQTGRIVAAWPAAFLLIVFLSLAAYLYLGVDLTFDRPQ